MNRRLVHYNAVWRIGSFSTMLVRGLACLLDTVTLVHGLGLTLLLLVLLFDHLL